MSSEVLERRFATIGARVKLSDGPWLGVPRIDVRADRRGEYFDFRFAGGEREVGLEVVDARPNERHLLLLVRDGREKSKFLLGHDERHWFVAAVPESVRGVTGIASAMRALQPELVQAAVVRKRPRDPFRRKNRAYRRQGEWFFVPEPALRVDPREILHDEPISRGPGKPHVLELACRRGGETVYVSRRHPAGISEARFAALSEEARRDSWARMVRGAAVFAKGAVRHPDHASIVLHEWHRVAMNTEQRARAMRHLAFLD